MTRKKSILLIAVLLTAAIFLVDLNTELGVAGGVPYIIVVLLGLLYNDKRFFLVSGIAGIALTILGFYLSPSGGELNKVILNRIYAISAIFVTAFLGRMFLIQQEEFASFKNEFRERLDSEEELADFLSAQSGHADSEETFRHAMQMCLENICKISLWPLGHMYLVSDAGDRCLPSGVWYVNAPERFQEFIKTTEATCFDKGVGLPGRVLAHGEPVFITDVNTDSNFPRAEYLTEVAIRGAFAIPVKIKGKTQAVLEFFQTTGSCPMKKLWSSLIARRDRSAEFWSGGKTNWH